MPRRNGRRTGAPEAAADLSEVHLAAAGSLIGGTVAALQLTDTTPGALTMGVAAGTQIWCQRLVQDASVTAGITLSCGLLATTP